VAGLYRYAFVWLALTAILSIAGCGTSTTIPACENDEECADFQCGEGEEAVCEIPVGDIFGICGCITPDGSGGTGGDGRS
jgi:hypothetical protein